MTDKPDTIIQGNESQPPRFVVGVGASAGGLQALEEFFRHMPGVDDIAFVVVQHLSPDYESLMAELLGKHTKLPVRKAINGVTISGGEVWVIPPRKNITIVKGRIVLTDQPPSRTFNLPIDVFLRSLAREYEERAIAVILSGTGSDGTLGIREVKGVGGLVLVQDPESARFDGMPRSALATHIVDVVGPAEELVKKIVQFVHPSVTPAILVGEQPGALETIFRELKAFSGIDFTAYRLGTLMRRITKRMQMAQLSELPRYAEFLAASSREVEALYRDVLIGVTSFFRDREAFEALRSHVVPLLCSDLPVRSTVRVWSVGCSTGEEPYSLGALFLSEFERRERPDLNLKVFATDIDPDALRIAANGVYPVTALQDVPLDLISRSFVHEGDNYRVTEKLRRCVIYSRHNICSDPPFNRIDLIACRNMLIYLNTEVQRRILEVFGYALKPEGCLFLGHSESLSDDLANYSTINRRWKIYRRKSDALRPSLRHLIVPDRDFSGQRFESNLNVKPVHTANREARLFRQIMARYAPPSVVFDQTLRVLLSFGPISDFLQLPVGEFDHDLLRLALPELSAVLSTVTHRVFKTRERVTYRGVTVESEEGGIRHIDILAEPLSERGQSEREQRRELYVIVFHEGPQRKLVTVEDGADTTGTTDTIRYDTGQHIQDLKAELQYTKETLQATIEELETSNEELQATNEELLASNEELQSTNEELQSVNEELVTVNTEYQEKIVEISEVNNDIENLLSNTRLGVIFLDRRMCVRRFTPSVRKLVNLIPSDVGRRLTDLSFRTKPSDFVELAHQVLETLIPTGRLIRADDGTMYRLDIVPYRTTDDIIQGVVLLFVDVSENHKLTAQLERTEEALSKLKARAALHILLIEDNPDDLVMIQTALKRTKLHCEVSSVGTLADARAALKSQPLPDLILLDVGLPDGSGLDLLTEIKHDPKVRHIPVVIVSQTAEKNMVKEAYGKYASCFVSKQVDLVTLESIVRNVAGFYFTIVNLPQREDA